MASVTLSAAEEVFIVQGVKENYRSDGRSNVDYRPMELETDVVSNTNGSARLRLANTDVLIGVKTEIDVPKPEAPSLGKLDFFVDCSANASPEFEGRGGEDLANNIANIMYKAYHSAQAFDLKQLCIMEGKQCWKLYIDILILECGGNLFDAVSMAVKAALFSTKIPLVQAGLMDGGNVDLQISDDPYDCRHLEIGGAPLLITLCRIGDQCIVDPTAEEEFCSHVSAIVGVTGNPQNYTDGDIDLDESVQGKISTISMNGCGSFSQKTLKGAITQGRLAATELDKALSRALLKEREETKGIKKYDNGFLK